MSDFIALLQSLFPMNLCMLIEYTDTMMELPRPQSLAIKLGKKRKYLMRENEKTQKENEQLE